MADDDKPADRMSPKDWARNTVKSPDDFPEGKEPMTEHQRSHLKVLSQEAGEAFDESLSRTEAERRIDELQQKTGNRP